MYMRIVILRYLIHIKTDFIYFISQPHYFQFQFFAPWILRLI